MVAAADSTTAGVTTLVSTDSDGGVQGNGQSNLPSISADGRYVAFSSADDNLVLGDTWSGRDIFVKDRGDLASPQPQPVTQSTTLTTKSTSALGYNKRVTAVGGLQAGRLRPHAERGRQILLPGVETSGQDELSREVRGCHRIYGKPSGDHGHPEGLAFHSEGEEGQRQVEDRKGEVGRFGFCDTYAIKMLSLVVSYW